MPSPAVIIAAVLFGTIGLVSFNYGRKNICWGPMVIGLGLMVFPYFIAQTWLVYAVGAALCAGLYFWRD